MKAEQKLAALRKQLAGENDADNRKAIQQSIDLTERTEKLALANAVNRSGSDQFWAAPGTPVGSGIRGYGVAAEVAAHNADYAFRQQQIKGAGASVGGPPAGPRPAKADPPARERVVPGGGSRRAARRPGEAFTFQMLNSP